MVEKLQKIAKKIKQEKGSLTLLAILKIDDLVDTWSILFSAEWMNTENKIEMKGNFSYLFNLLESTFSSEELRLIARIGIFPKDYYLIKELSNFKTGAHVTDTTQINGNTIHEAHIIYSKK